MPLINFKLRRIDEIAPWGEATAPVLHWFGLSDGWFWLRLGEQEVFKTQETASTGRLPYVDYQVVRLWEDVLDMLPAVLEPVVPDVAELLSDGDGWDQTVSRLHSDEFLNDDATADLVAEGLSWWGSRKLDTGYLVDAPSVHVWRHADRIHFRWASHPDGSNLWAPVQGAMQLELSDFQTQIAGFNDAFLRAMNERVSSIIDAGGIPNIAVDLSRLQEEQRDRSEWLSRAVTRPPPNTNWNVTRDLLSRLGL